MNLSKSLILLLSIFLILVGCKNGKLPGADAREVPYDARERVRKNIEEGKGFRIADVVGKKKGGDFEFASSNELWRASLDVIDFMPLASANYSGGMIITDWYADNSNPNESIKLTIRFLSNEVRSDALSIKIFYRTCEEINKCVVNEKTGPLAKELKKEILKIAATYKQQTVEKDFKPYRGFDRQK
tara:strand:+ start:375 stop:932 length:558 start_codon:yes stop_codon:yes gene_type:complete